MIGYVVVFLVGLIIGVAFTAVQAAKKIRHYESLLNDVRRALAGEEEVTL